MKHLLILLSLVGCGMQQKVKGGTHNEVYVDAKAEAKAEVTIILKIDLTSCDEFYGTYKLECIENITGVFDGLGDLSKILVCPPEQQARCELLETILDGAADDK